MELKKYPLQKLSLHVSDGNTIYQIVINVIEKYLKLYKSVGPNKWEQIIAESLSPDCEDLRHLKLFSVSPQLQEGIDTLLNLVAVELAIKKKMDGLKED